jgi:hypothetical protein
MATFNMPVLTSGADGICVNAAAMGTTGLGIEGYDPDLTFDESML